MENAPAVDLQRAEPHQKGVGKPVTLSFTSFPVGEPVLGLATHIPGIVDCLHGLLKPLILICSSYIQLRLGEVCVVLLSTVGPIQENAGIADF